jgi:hypothetical protein
MKKGDRKGSSDFDGSRDRVFERENKNGESIARLPSSTFPLDGKGWDRGAGTQSGKQSPLPCLPLQGEGRETFLSFFMTDLR